MGTDFLLGESRYQQRTEPGKHHLSIADISHCSTPLLAMQHSMEAPGCTASMLQKDFAVTFHLSCLTIDKLLQMTDEHLHDLKAALSPSLALQRGAMLVAGLHPGVVGHEEAAQIPQR